MALEQGAALIVSKPLALNNFRQDAVDRRVQDSPPGVPVRVRTPASNNDAGPPIARPRSKRMMFVKYRRQNPASSPSNGASRWAIAPTCRQPRRFASISACSTEPRSTSAPHRPDGVNERQPHPVVPFLAQIERKGKPGRQARMARSPMSSTASASTSSASQSRGNGSNRGWTPWRCRSKICVGAALVREPSSRASGEWPPRERG